MAWKKFGDESWRNGDYQIQRMGLARDTYRLFHNSDWIGDFPLIRFARLCADAMNRMSGDSEVSV